MLSKLLKKENLVFVWPVLTSIFLILALPPYNLDFLIWIALVPLLFFIKSEKTSLAMTFKGGLLAGFLFFGKFFDWYFATFPFDWLGISGSKETILASILLLIVWLMQTVFLALFLGVFAWLVKKVLLRTRTFGHLLWVVPALWILLEYLRSWGLGLLWFGPESILGPDWTFANLAYALHQRTILIQIAGLGGIYLLSFLIAWVNIWILLFVKSWRKHSRQIIVRLIVLFMTISLAWTSYGFYQLSQKEPHPKLKIALWQTNFSSLVNASPAERKNDLNKILELIKSPALQSEKPDLIIFPEGAGPASLLGGSTSWANRGELAQEILKNWLPPNQILIENQRIIDESGQARSRLFYYDLEEREPLAFADKRLLVPNGDFLPFLSQFFLRLYSFDLSNKERFYSPGKTFDVAVTDKAIIGGTICSSILSPRIQGQMSKKGGEVLIIVSSDAPFHNSIALLSQNLAMAKLRAVETGRYLAQATNQGLSFVIDQKGRVVSQGEDRETNITFANLEKIDQQTPYTKFGDWFILVFALLLSTYLFFLFHGKIKKK